MRCKVKTLEIKRYIYQSNLVRQDVVIEKKKDFSNVTVDLFKFTEEDIRE